MTGQVQQHHHDTDVLRPSASLADDKWLLSLVDEFERVRTTDVGDCHRLPRDALFRTVMERLSKPAVLQAHAAGRKN